MILLDSSSSNYISKYDMCIIVYCFKIDYALKKSMACRLMLNKTYWVVWEVLRAQNTCN